MISLHFFSRRLSRYSLGLLLGIGLTVAAAANDGRIALVGDGFGRTEIATIRKTVIQKEVPNLAIEECGGFLEADRYKDFRGVVIGGGEKGRAYTPEESEKIREWVNGGGQLLLIRQAPRLLVVNPTKDRDDSYLFGRSYYMRAGASSSVVHPDSPILKGAFEHGNSPFWLKGNVLLKGLGWTQLIGENEAILVGEMKVGKGTVYFLGSELFRVLKEGNELQKQSEAAGWAQIIENILSAMVSTE